MVQSINLSTTQKPTLGFIFGMVIVFLDAEILTES
jgi:hypothetical protein